MSIQTLLYRDSHNRNSGFTIVEIVVVMAVMAISVVALVSLVQIIQHTQRDIYYMNQANDAARSKITDLQKQDFSSLTIGSEIDFSSDPSLDNLPDATAKAFIEAADLASESKQVDVSITYKVGSVEKYVTITAYINPTENL